MRDSIGNPNTVHDLPKLQHGLSMLEMSLAGAFDPPRVLVADDDPITSQLLNSIGAKEGYQVVSVRDGREAYRTLRSDADFRAAIFNMTMPHLQGVDIVRYMKTEKRLMRIPVVVVCGEHGLKLMADSFAAGAIAFMTKPFTADQLQLTLHIALSSRNSRKEILRAA
jgi:DNA-binding NtrC family response regulator